MQVPHLFVPSNSLVSLTILLELNTTSGAPGNQSDGGGVYRRRRSLLERAAMTKPAITKLPRRYGV